MLPSMTLMPFMLHTSPTILPTMCVCPSNLDDRAHPRIPTMHMHDCTCMILIFWYWVALARIVILSHWKQTQTHCRASLCIALCLACIYEVQWASLN